MCVVQCGAHGVFALRWIPAGSLSGDAHLHRGSGITGWDGGEYRQTCTHKQTDEYARAQHGWSFGETDKDRYTYIFMSVKSN